MSERKVMNNERKRFALYIGLCVLITAICFGWMSYKGLFYSYLDIGADTYSSYWPYYASFRQALLEGNLSFWSFSLGMGGSLMGASSLLVDPFNVLLFLFPAEEMSVGLGIVTVVKYLVLAVLAWLYIGELGYRNVPRMAAALCITFCGFFTGWGQHYHFATMFVMFILVMYAFERYVSSGRWMLLILAIGMLAAHSVYFTFMILLLMAAYSIIRYFALHNFSWKPFFIYCLRLLGIVLGGLALAAVLVLPQVASLLNSPRISGNELSQLIIISWNQLATVAGRFLSNSQFGVNIYTGVINFYEGPFLYVGILLLIILPLLFKRGRQNRLRIIIMAIIAFALLFPETINPVFNAFSSRTSRWTFILVPAFALAIAEGVRSLLDESKEKTPVSGFIIAVALWCYSTIWSVIRLGSFDSLDLNAKISIISTASILFIYFVVFVLSKKLIKKIGLVLIVILCMELGINLFVSVNLRSLVPLDGSFTIPYFDNTLTALDTVREMDDDFYRVGKDYGTNDLTDPLIQNYFGEKQYSSVASGELWSFMEAFQLRGQSSGLFYGFGHNELLRGFLNGKYFFSRNNTDRYSYDHVFNTRDGITQVYKNRYYLPLGFIYTRQVDQSAFYKASVMERTAYLFAGYLTQDETEAVCLAAEKEQLPIVKETTIPANVLLYDDITNNIQYEQVANFLPQYTGLIPGIVITPEERIDGIITLELTIETPTKATAAIYYKTDNEYSISQVEYFTIYPNQTEYEILLSIDNITQLRIDFPTEITEYGGINATIQKNDLSTFDALRNSLLKNGSFEIRNFQQSRIAGIIEAKEDGLLFFSIPYNSGWKVIIDGKSIQPQCVNIMFMGVPIKEGLHSVVIEYRQPGLLEGGVISLCAIVTISIIYIISRKRKKR